MIYQNKGQLFFFVVVFKGTNNISGLWNHLWRCFSKRSSRIIQSRQIKNVLSCFLIFTLLFVAFFCDENCNVWLVESLEDLLNSCLNIIGVD